jgi:hypothetical protein
VLDRLFVRLLAVLLMTSVPVVLLLAGLLTGQASQSLTASGARSVTNLAAGPHRSSTAVWRLAMAT